MARKQVWLSWSTGKDSAWTLHVLQQNPAVEVAGLFTTVNAEFQRTAMHAVRVALLRAQAAAAGLPLIIAELPWPCSNGEYEKVMAGLVEQLHQRGAQAVAFGDLFLEDVRAYRERQMENTGLELFFPLWGRPTDALAHEMIDGGLQATLTCVDPRVLPATFAGRAFDHRLLADLPRGIDPCGERGEFHTFVHAGPMFQYPLAVRTGEVVQRDGFVFCDVCPLEDEASGTGLAC